MKPYVGTPETDSKYMDRIIGGQIKMVDGRWYWTEYHVAYAQRPMDTSANFVTLEEATAHFEQRLAEARNSWGFGGRQFSEEVVSDNPESRRIRFRSIRKNGKPGTLTGLLYMHKINRP